MLVDSLSAAFLTPDMLALMGKIFAGILVIKFATSMVKEAQKRQKDALRVKANRERRIERAYQKHHKVMTAKHGPK